MELAEKKEFVNKQIGEWLATLKLEHWLVRSNLLGREVMTGDADGRILADWRHQRAVMDIADDLEGEDLVDTVVHELCHLFLAGLEGAYNHLVEAYVPPGQQPVLLETFGDMEEQAVCHIVRAVLYDNLMNLSEHAS